MGSEMCIRDSSLAAVVPKALHPYSIESAVSAVCAGPYAVFNGAVNVVLRERLYHEKAAFKKEHIVRAW